MEDAHQIQIQIPGLPGHSFIAVYDGHGGAVAAEIAGAHMLAYLQKQPQYVAYAAGGGADAVQELGQAMEAAFLEFDKDLPPKLHARGDTSGCTAVAAMITPTHIVCANSGDSRGCYCSGSEVPSAHSPAFHGISRADCASAAPPRAGDCPERGPQTNEPRRIPGAMRGAATLCSGVCHACVLPLPQRIEAAGGTVNMSRVDGSLAVSVRRDTVCRTAD
jgi:serine/threonine protein phosphatase PrpC